MSIRLTVTSLIEQVAEEQRIRLPPLSDISFLLDSGLDSLCFAIIVARLEDTLGYDPFTASDDVYFPVTLGDFVRVYEMPQSQSNSLRSSLARRVGFTQSSLWAADASVSLSDLAGDRVSAASRGASRSVVLVSTGDQLTAALALIELDGLAAPTDPVSARSVGGASRYVSAIAEADAIVSIAIGRNCANAALR